LDNFAPIEEGGRHSVRELVADGVPVYWIEADGPCVGGLVFRAGHADERPQTRGITHLVEHLAMAKVGERPYGCNASVGSTITQFVARGSPGEIAEFFRAVCLALGELPLDRAGMESNILRTESAARPAAPSINMAWLRYGPTGPGLAWMKELFLHRPETATIEAWRRAMFTRGNCAAWIAGSVPDGLEFPLADGALVPMPVARPVSDVRLPASIALEGDFVAVSYETPRSSISTTIERIAQKRIHGQARMERGLTYHILGDREAVSATRALSTTWMDFLPDRAAEARGELLRVFAELAEHGPTQQELDQDLDAYARFLADPAARPGAAAGAATYAVSGVPPLSVNSLLAERRLVTPEACWSELRPCLDTAILRAPARAGGLPGRFHAYTVSCQPVSGTTYTRSKIANSADRYDTLIIGRDGISRTAAMGFAITVKWSECVAMIVGADGSRDLVDIDGYQIHVAPSEWRHGHELAAGIDRNVPLELRIGPV
jgi:zinc protease